MWREKFEVNRTTASPTDAHLASLLRRLVRSFLRDEVERRLWLQRIVARPPGLVCVSIVEWDSRGAGTLVRPPAFRVRRVLFCTPSPPHPPPTPTPTVPFWASWDNLGVRRHTVARSWAH